MIKAWIVTTLLLVTVMYGIALADEQSISEGKELLTKVKSYYGTGIGFRADYELYSQPATMAQNGQLSEPRKTSGEIIFVRPDRLRLMQELPDLEEVVYSPNGYWWYSKKLSEAHRFPAGDVAGTVKPFISFFSGLESTEEHFDVKRILGLDRDDLMAVQLTPKSIKMGLNRLEILLTKQGRIDEVALHSLIGDIFKYVFKDVKVLDEPPMEGFSFMPPNGTKIVHH